MPSYYLDFENPSGPSISGPVNVGGKQVFAVDTFSWTDTPGRGGAGGLGGGRGPSSPFNITLGSTEETVLLLKAEATSQVFGTVHLYVFGSPGCATFNGAPFMDFKLSHALISTYRITGRTECCRRTTS